MEERDLNCSEEKSYYPIMGDFATKVTKMVDLLHICSTSRDYGDGSHDPLVEETNEGQQ